MSKDQIRELVRRALVTIAPDVELEGLDPRESLRDELDLDSMDMLALVRAIHAELGVDIPETDYARIGSLDGCVDYLAARLQSS